MLLYADYVVFFGKSAESLQQILNNLHTYSRNCGLSVNTDKTKILIFEKGRKFHYGDILLEVVESFKYITITFYKNVNWNRTQKYIAQHGS